MYKFLLITCILAVAYAANIDRDARILKQTSEHSGDGKYSWEFQTSNGIQQSEYGEGGKYAAGYSQWYAPDGTPFQISFVADENGYRPEGAHLPTPPPTPPAILRALEWIRTHPQPEHNSRY